MTQPEFRIILLTTLFFGGLGGLVYELMTLQGNLERPRRVKANDGSSVYDLGVWGRIILGALAALASLYVLSPEDAYKLVAISVVAGSSASVIFKALQARVEAVVAQNTAIQISDKAEELAGLVGGGEGAPAGGTRGVRGAAAPSSETDRRAAQLISEIRGLSATVKRPTPGS